MGTFLGGLELTDTSVKVNSLFLANIEALAQSEQPDISKCISPASTDCLALHPTNPELDKVVKNARWTN